MKLSKTRFTHRSVIAGLFIAMILFVARQALFQPLAPEILLPPGAVILDTLEMQTRQGEAITFVVYRDPISEDLGLGILQPLQDDSNRIGFGYIGRITGSAECAEADLATDWFIILTCNGVRFGLDLRNSSDMKDALPFIKAQTATFD